MDKYLEYYQFHEKDEEGNAICLYCTLKEENGKVAIQFIKNYDEALEELRNFAYANGITTTEDLKNDENLHLQVSNKDFRDMLKNKYNYDTSDIDNFNEYIKDYEDDDSIDYEGVLDPEPVKKLSIIDKLKNLKIKGVKKLAVRLAIIASAGFLGFAGIRGCSKKGTTDDLSTENQTETMETIDQQMIDAENEAKKNSQMADINPYLGKQDTVNAATINDLSTFETYLNQSCQITKDYMNAFKDNLASFNSVARNYIDSSKNSRLGLDTSNYTAFKMATLGERFGLLADNVSSYWYGDDLYNDYVKTNDQLKQLATVQKHRSGLAKSLDIAEQQDFYLKYEDMIIDLNTTADDNDKITKAENILNQIKEDFHMDSENYDPTTLLRSDAKYIAVMPMVRSVYDRAKNSNYENLPDDSKMHELSKAYRKVVKENISKALDSIDVKESITPSYEMYEEEIASKLSSLNLYVIDDERNIRDTELYKQNKTLPVKVIEVTPTPTPVADNSNIDIETIENTGAAEVDIPTYSTTDDNYVYQEEAVNANDSTVDDTTDNAETVDDITDNTISESPIADQIIESDEGTPSDTITNDDNTVADDNQIIESEEDIANSMNDTINSGSYAESPDGWQIDDDYKIGDTNVIDGSVSDITVEEPAPTEEVPTTDETITTEENSTVPDTTDSYSEIIESEENYDAPAAQDAVEPSTNEESVVTEEVSTYDESEPIIDDTTDENQVTENASDITTYEEAIPVEQTVAKLDQEQAIDQVISYNANGVNAIPVFNADDNSWHVQVIETPVEEIKPVQYNI